MHPLYNQFERFLSNKDFYIVEGHDKRFYSLFDALHYCENDRTTSVYQIRLNGKLVWEINFN